MEAILEYLADNALLILLGIENLLLALCGKKKSKIERLQNITAKGLKLLAEIEEEEKRSNKNGY